MCKSLCNTGLRWLWVMVLVIVVDLATKYWVIANMQLHESRTLFPFFNLFYAHNYGAAFSFLADKGGWQRWMFAGIAMAIAVVLLVMMYRNRADQNLVSIAYAMIIGGALGNLVDRTWHGFVVDFIDFYIGNWHFATFNIADCGICVGAALVVLEGLLPRPQPANKESE